jgi:hypothetical protein
VAVLIASVNVGVILRGFAFAFLASIGFSLLASLAICLGLDPETRRVADTMAPLLGLFTGTGVAVRDGSWRAGLVIGCLYVALWLLLWLYLMARWNPIDWLHVGLPRLTAFHFRWWAVALAVAVSGAALRNRRTWFALTLTSGVLIWLICSFAYAHQCVDLDGRPIHGLLIERSGPTADGTVFYQLLVDADAPSFPEVFPYDCDQDYREPKRGLDENTTFLGHDISAQVRQIDPQLSERTIVCAINGGFFGESGWSVAHHEEPMAINCEALYPVDLLRPRDQTAFFIVKPVDGRDRFSIAYSVTPSEMKKETVLGGVRPLRVDGKSLPLEPGAGATGLRCSRTSVGWCGGWQQAPHPCRT